MNGDLLTSPHTGHSTFRKGAVQLIRTAQNEVLELHQLQGLPDGMIVVLGEGIQVVANRSCIQGVGTVTVFLVSGSPHGPRPLSGQRDLIETRKRRHTTEQNRILRNDAHGLASSVEANGRNIYPVNLYGA